MFTEYDSDRSFRLHVEERNAIYVLTEIGARLYKIYTNSTEACETDVHNILENSRCFEDNVITMRISRDLFSIHQNWSLIVDFAESFNYRELLLQTLRELNR